MRAEGSVRLEAGREAVWARLSDPRELERVLPAVEEVSISDADSFSLLVSPSTGLGETPLWIEVEVSERREGEHVRLRCRGRRSEYDAALDVGIDLDGDGSQCSANWSAEASFGGVWSALGQRVLPAILSSQIERVLLAAAEAR